MTSWELQKNFNFEKKQIQTTKNATTYSHNRN